MKEPTGSEQLRRRDLVLGFDGGCFSCLGLAGRLGARVAGKLRVRDLRDPVVAEWHEKALGRDARWAPTLFEVHDGGVVEAWTGWRMGAALARFLGPTDTWKVLQLLGEVKADIRMFGTTPAAVSGMSRGRFLKGLGGAAVAVSALSGIPLLPSVATGQETSLPPGTEEMRRKAKSIVRTSPQYKALADLQSPLGVEFAFADAEIGFHKVNNRNHAIVAVNSVADPRSVGVIFNVNMYSEKMYKYSHEVFAPLTSRDDAVRITSFNNGYVVPEYHKVTVGKTENWVILQDNSLISKEEFERRIEGDAQAAGVQGRDGGHGACSEIEYQQKVNFCMYNGLFACTAAGLLNVGVGLVCGAWVAFSGGCESSARAECAREAEAAAVVQQPPKYYCT